LFCGGGPVKFLSMLTREEYKAIVEQAPILIWRARLDKLCDYFNERWLQFTGRSFEQEFGNGWAEGVHPEDFEECLKIYTENFDKRQTFEMYYRLKRADGQYRWIFDRGVPYFESNGEFKGFIGSCIDVTEKIESERVCRQMKENEIKKLIALLPVCAWCKKVRTDDGYWQEMEQYVLTQHDGRITHGICKECDAKVMMGRPSPRKQGTGAAS
jgi:PAS domain S-box-containing protein